MKAIDSVAEASLLAKRGEIRSYNINQSLSKDILLLNTYGFGLEQFRIICSGWVFC